MNKSHYREWMSFIREEHSRADVEIYLVLDGSSHPALPQIIWELDGNPEALPLYMNTYLEDVAKAGPWILPFKPEGEIAHWFFEKAEFHPVGIIAMVPRGQYDIFFEHLQSILECQYPPQSKKDIRMGKVSVSGLFRYYDPRILYGISTYADKKIIQRTCRPSCAMGAWEPGRQEHIYISQDITSTVPSEDDLLLPQEFIDHLWREVQIHTVIGTMGAEAGVRLRAMRLPEAYSFCENIQRRLDNSPYTGNTDMAFAVACCLYEDKTLEALDVLVEKKYFSYPDLQGALEKVLVENVLSEENVYAKSFARGLL